MLHFIKHELLQFFSSNNDVLTFVAGDFWNALDFASLFTMLLTYVVRVYEFIFGLGYSYSPIAMSVSLPLVYLNSLYYLQVRASETRRTR